MNPTSGAVLRGDLNAVVEQAAGADRYHIADAVLPAVGVSERSGQYPVLQIAAGELLSDLSTDRKSTGSYGEVSRQWTSDTYDCVDRGLEEPVGDTDAKDLAKYFSLEAASARLCLRNMKIARERRASAAIMNASTFTDYTAAAVAYTAANIATIDFVRDVKAAIARVEDRGEIANTIVLSKTVADRLALATLLQSYMRGTRPADAAFVINSATLQQIFADDGITQVLIGRSRYNSAKKGQPASITMVWPVTYIWVGNATPAATEAGIVLGGTGHTLVWNAEGGLWVTESYRNEARRSNMVRVRQHCVEKIVNANAGTLITTSYA